MEDLTPIVDTAAAVTPPDAVTPPEAPVRPEWMPEKFWKDGLANTEELAKAYKSLETKLGSRSPVAPEKPEDYQLKPTDWPAEHPWNDEAAGKLAATFHSAGLSQDQAAAVGAAIIEMERESQKAIADGSNGAIDAAVAKLEEDRITEHNKSVVEGMGKLRTEWGHEYDTRVNDIKQIALNMGFDVKDPDLFGSAKVIKMLGRFTSLIGEEAGSILRGGSLKSAGFADGPTEANAIMSDPSHPDHKAYRSGDRKVVVRVNALLRQGMAL